MPHSIFAGNRFKNRVRVWNDAGDESVGYNLVVYTGGDIITGLLAGNQAFKLSMFYFEYINTTGGISEPAVSRSDTAALRQAMAAPHDLLRSQLSAAPLISTSGVNYQGNQASLFAATSASTGALHGLPFTAAANSNVYAVGLMATPTPGDLTKDILYARYLLASPVPVTGSGQISAAWLVEAD